MCILSKQFNIKKCTCKLKILNTKKRDKFNICLCLKLTLDTNTQKDNPTLET